MLQSYVIEANGTFIGAAISIVGGFRFRAVHPQVAGFDGWTWRTLSGLRRAAGHMFITGQHVRQGEQGQAGGEASARASNASRVSAPRPRRMA